MKMGKVPILETINKIPGGLMVVPLVLGVLTNTFFPEALMIGSFTTAFFKSGALTLIALLFFLQWSTDSVQNCWYVTL